MKYTSIEWTSAISYIDYELYLQTLSLASPLKFYGVGCLYLALNFGKASSNIFKLRDNKWIYQWTLN